MDGLKAILPEKPLTKEELAAARKPVSPVDPLGAAVVPAAPQGEGRRRGRPAGSGKVDDPRRAVSCKMLEEQYRKVGIIAFNEHMSRQDLMDLAYSRLILSYEKVNGALDPDSYDSLGDRKVGF